MIEISRTLTVATPPKRAERLLADPVKLLKGVKQAWAEPTTSESGGPAWHVGGILKGRAYEGRLEQNRGEDGTISYQGSNGSYSANVLVKVTSAGEDSAQVDLKIQVTANGFRSGVVLKTLSLAKDRIETAADRVTTKLKKRLERGQGQKRSGSAG